MGRQRTAACRLRRHVAPARCREPATLVRRPHKGTSVHWLASGTRCVSSATIVDRTGNETSTGRVRVTVQAIQQSPSSVLTYSTAGPAIRTPGRTVARCAPASPSTSGSDSGSQARRSRWYPTRPPTGAGCGCSSTASRRASSSCARPRHPVAASCSISDSSREPHHRVWTMGSKREPSRTGGYRRLPGHRPLRSPTAVDADGQRRTPGSRGLSR